MGDKPAPFTLVTEGSEYELLVSVETAAFLLRSKADDLAAHLQGDDAARFREDYDAIKLQFPHWTADQVLARLWDQGGYSWLATQEGD